MSNASFFTFLLVLMTCLFFLPRRENAGLDSRLVVGISGASAAKLHAGRQGRRQGRKGRPQSGRQGRLYTPVTTPRIPPRIPPNG
uniref:Uncharacterized protein n=1 Tax=Rhipicephalus appendiculatus TaxID=34631 RepID=A0A131Y930_RHIAP